MDGRLTTAACGHPGRHVIGQYVECLTRGCEGLAGKELCPKCGSSDVEPFVLETLPPGTKHCRTGGHVWWDISDAAADDSSDDGV